MLTRLLRLQRLVGLTKSRPNLPPTIRLISTTPAVLRRSSHFRYVGTEPDNFDEVESVWFLYYSLLWLGFASTLTLGYYEYYISRIGERFTVTPSLTFDSEKNPLEDKEQKK